MTSLFCGWTEPLKHWKIKFSFSALNPPTDKEIKLYRRSATVFFFIQFKIKFKNLNWLQLNLNWELLWGTIASSFLNWKTCDIQFALVWFSTWFYLNLHWNWLKLIQWKHIRYSIGSCLIINIILFKIKFSVNFDTVQLTCV